MDGSVLDEKLYFKMMGFTLSSKLDLGYGIASIVKTFYKKFGMKQIYRTVCPLLGAFLELLAHHQVVAILSFFL